MDAFERHPPSYNCSWRLRVEWACRTDESDTNRHGPEHDCTSWSSSIILPMGYQRCCTHLQPPAPFITSKTHHTISSTIQASPKSPLPAYIRMQCLSSHP